MFEGWITLSTRWIAIQWTALSSLWTTGSWVERSTVGVKCVNQEHNTMSPARARTWTAHSGVGALTMRPPRLPPYKALLANIKIECQRWPEKPFILERSGTQYVFMVTKRFSLYCGAHKNWPRYLFSSYLIKIWLITWHHHLANLHVLKTWISLERKVIFGNSKQPFSAHSDYLVMF